MAGYCSDSVTGRSSDSQGPDPVPCDNDVVCRFSTMVRFEPRLEGQCCPVSMTGRIGRFSSPAAPGPQLQATPRFGLELMNKVQVGGNLIQARPFGAPALAQIQALELSTGPEESSDGSRPR